MITVVEKRKEQLTKAKEIIENLLDDLIAIDGEETGELEAVKEAREFLKKIMYAQKSGQ